MAKLVKCVYCQNHFDREKEETVSISARRYAHKSCHDAYGAKKTQEELDYEALENYIKKLFNEPFVSAQVKKQIKDYRSEYQYTYTGILKTLIYWYEVKGNSILDKNQYGIAIVPYIYKQASEYYYALFIAQQANSDKHIEDFIPQTKEVVISTPTTTVKPRRLFKFSEAESE